MATIIHKTSNTEGNEPTIAQLSLGELAINTFDGKVFFKMDDGAESVIELTDIQPRKIYEFVATNAQIIFGPILYVHEENVDVYLNGILLSDTDYALRNNNELETYEEVQLNDKIIVKTWAK